MLFHSTDFCHLRISWSIYSTKRFSQFMKQTRGLHTLFVLTYNEKWLQTLSHRGSVGRLFYHTGYSPGIWTEEDISHRSPIEHQLSKPVRTIEVPNPRDQRIFSSTRVQVTFQSYKSYNLYIRGHIWSHKTTTVVRFQFRLTLIVSLKPSPPLFLNVFYHLIKIILIVYPGEITFF